MINELQIDMVPMKINRNPQYVNKHFNSSTFCQLIDFDHVCDKDRRNWCNQLIMKIFIRDKRHGIDKHNKEK